MSINNSYLNGTGSFVSTAKNAGAVKIASFSDSSVNTGVVAISATFTGTSVNSGTIGWFSQMGLDIDDTAYSISMNSAGNRIISSDNFYDNFRGCVKIYSWDGTSWVQLGSTLYGDEEMDFFGISVSMNDEGDRIVIGSSNNTIQTDESYTRVYSWDGTSWVQLGSDIMMRCSQLSMNSVGDRIVIGVGGDYSYVKVYSWNGTSWVQLGSTLYKDTQDISFGYNVCINSVGDRIGVRVSNNHVKVYSWDGTSWVQLGSNLYGNNLDPDNQDDFFGSSLSMNSLGDRIVIGSQNDYVKVCTWNGTSWTESTITTDNRVRPYQVPAEVAINDIGDRIAIGRSSDNFTYIFSWNGTEWVKLVSNIIGAYNESHGFNICMNSTGSRVAFTVTTEPISSNSNVYTYGIRVYSFNI